jgi:hypothetical protein
MRGTQKRDKKNHGIVRVKKFNPGQIKYVRTLAVFFYYFFCRPLTKHEVQEGHRRAVAQQAASSAVSYWLLAAGMMENVEQQFILNFTHICFADHIGFR